MKSAIKKAIIELKDEMRCEGCNPNIDNVDYDALTKAVEDEYACGRDGTIFEAIVDLHNTIGLKEFGFIEDEEG